MPLVSGARLGPYEIIAAIGAGGMGEVYRARDTRLERTVAIKILPVALAVDPQFRERFEREAKSISALTHPNICTLYDVGRDRDIAFLVLEYLEGETLAARLSKGALTLPDALRIAIEIAGALDTAHRHGIVHRDLKPGNVMLTKGGAKLLDFGLAKLRPAGVVSGATPTTPPTATTPLTAQGTILGTFQYMAPEQIEGREADERTDIFAFGTVVYEMLTGKKAFEGKSQASLIGAILHLDPPPMSALQPLMPPALDRVVNTCLAKDPDQRWQSAHDLTSELTWIAEGGPQGGMPSLVVGRPRRDRLGWMVAAVLLLVALALAATVYVQLERGPGEVRVHKLSVLPPENAMLMAGQAPIVSADGRLLAFVALDASGRSLLYVRPLDALVAQPLAGTDGATLPFWSPDSRFIGFFAGGKLKTIAVTGRQPYTLAAATNGRGGAWNRDGVIIFSPSPPDPLYRVSATGGHATPLASIDLARGEGPPRWMPSFLPDGRHYLYLAPSRTGNELRVGSLDSKESKRLLDTHANAVYTPPGYLLFWREATLMAQRFDAAQLELAGDPIPIAEQVGFDALTFQASFSVSDTGVLAFHSGTAGKTQFTWFDRSGKPLGVAGLPGDQGDLQLSPDDTRVAFHHVDAQTGAVNIWIMELAPGTISRFTFDQTIDFTPIWSPKGDRIVFASLRDGPPNLYQKVSSRPGNEEALLKSFLPKLPTDWSLDGRFIVYGVIDPTTRWDLWVLPLTGDRQPFPFLRTDFDERQGSFSPNGRWLAYMSNESGRNEVYVRPFPPGAGEWQASTAGGDQPRWRRDGKMLFYLAADRKLMAVDVKTDAPTFESGVPKVLFQTRVGGKDSPGDDYAVTVDGRFLLNSLVAEAAHSPITVILNWQAALEARERR
jgi:Tol biopolymer transport system component